MELSQCKERLDAWFSDKEPEMLSMLERIVNMDSFTNDAADVNKVGEVVTGWLAEAGFHTAKLPKKPAPADEQWMNGLGNVFSARTHSVECGPGVAFIGHMDTVFPAGTAGARPFRLDRAADRATGPGVTDMKAGIVQNMFVARALKELARRGTRFPFHNPHSGRAAQRRAGRHLYRTGLSRRRGDAGT